MRNINERLAEVYPKITDQNFLKNKGLGNEVGYYIFDYSPKDELAVREHIAHIKSKAEKIADNPKLIEFDLYEIVMGLLKTRGYMEKCFEFEKTKGFDYTAEAIIKMLKLTSKSNEVINYIIDNTSENSVVLITGIGKCFPLVRSHNILNNLHQVLDKVPVVMFYPGEYSGQDLRLFGSIKDDNYYRAFRLVSS